MTERHQGFPTAPQAALLLVTLFLLEVLLGVLLRGLNAALGLSDAALAALDSLLANGLLLSAVLQYKGIGHRALVHPSAASPLATFALLLPPLLLLTPALVLLLGVANDWMMRLLPLSAWEAEAFDAMSATDPASLIAGCLLAPVLEEMLFRGVVLRGFLHQYPRGQAIAGSAILFGAAHLNIYQFVVAVVIGSLAGWLYERTRSLLPGITLHVAFNSLVALLGAADDSGAAAAAVADGSATAASGPVWLLTMTLGLVGAWWLRRLLR